MAETVFLTGSSGALGTRLAQALLARGHKVRGYDVRDPAPELAKEPGFEHVNGDVADYDGLLASMGASEQAVHCAALLPDKNYLGREAHFRVNTAGAVNFLKACQAGGVRKAVIISNTGVLEPNRSGVTCDSAGYRKKGTPYLESKIQAEKEIDRLGLRDRIHYLILRPASIYGQGAYYKWADIFRMARMNRLFVVGRGDALYSIIHIDDLVEAILMALQKLDSALSGEKITITSNENLSIHEILSCISSHYSSRPPVRVPLIPALTGAIILQCVSRLMGIRRLSSVTTHNILDYRYGLFFDSTKAMRLIGFESKRSYEREIIRVMESHDAT